MPGTIAARPLLPRLARTAIGLAVVVAVLHAVDWRDLLRHLRGVDLALVAVAVGAATLANVLSARRWRNIARAAGIDASLRTCAILYWRGVAANAVLPGATLGGDVLRAVQLAARGHSGTAATLSVLLDRAAGLWGQAVVSGIALAAVAVIARVAVPPAVLATYAVVLVAIIALPWLPIDRLAGSRMGWLRRASAAGRRWRAYRRRGPATLARVAWSSVVVALATTSAFWLCLRATGVRADPIVTAAVAAGIFMIGMVPVALAGFGPREAAAAAAFALLGISPAGAAAAALLYGLAATIQGIAASALFLVPAETDDDARPGARSG